MSLPAEMMLMLMLIGAVESLLMLMLMLLVGCNMLLVVLLGVEGCGGGPLRSVDVFF